MGAQAAVNFLISDHGDKNPPSGFRKTFAGDEPYKSILQRNGIDLKALLQKFDWSGEDSQWVAEYTGKREVEKLIKLRRAICFLISGWRDIYEDLGTFDVSSLRYIRAPYVTSRTPLRVMQKEFQ